MLLELDKKIFGDITTKEIIGAVPPAIPDTRELLEKELENLLSKLESAPRKALEKLLEQQKAFDAHINSRPGAMALAQNKIQLYNEFSGRYSDAIRKKLAS